MKRVELLYGKGHLTVEVPDSVDVLENAKIPAVENPLSAIQNALANPIASDSLKNLIAAKQPKTVAITISDITRPVPNKVFLPVLIETLNSCGITDEQIVIIVGTGMHRPSTREEHIELVGQDILNRIEILDHCAADTSTLTRVCDEPPISICSRFAQADFRIVTGYIEAHFMAGFSGGRKGVCPALVDLETIKNFHGYKTLKIPSADTGNLEKNPCHKIALKIAKTVGVDFLFNVAINDKREIAGVYCGDLEQAHLAGCADVAAWTTVDIEQPYALVVTNGGGYPLDQTFYQTVKGMCTALPAMDENTTLMQVSECAEQLGSGAYTKLLLKYGHDWQRFMEDISKHDAEFMLDQWEFQMQIRVLQRIGREKLCFISDGLSEETQQQICVNPVISEKPAQQRLQQFIDDYIAANPAARVAVIPEGPYTMIRVKP